MDSKFGDKRWNLGKSFKPYHYTLLDIAELKGVSVEHVRNLVSQGKLNPASLGGVLRYIQDRPRSGTPVTSYRHTINNDKDTP